DIGTNSANGIAAFTNLEIDTAGPNYQLAATSPDLTTAQSSIFAVGGVSFLKLQLLVPGESAAPGTDSGKTGTPTTQAARTPFTVRINAVDTNWNVSSTISDVIGLSSSDPRATLPPSAALAGGTKTCTVTLASIGSATLTASDITEPFKPAYTSPSIIA